MMQITIKKKILITQLYLDLWFILYTLALRCVYSDYTVVNIVF